MIIRLKRLVWMASVSALLLFCEKNLHGPDSDPANNIPAQQSDLRLLTMATIGPEGGTVDLDSVIIKVPANAFKANASLFVFSSQEVSPFDNDAFPTIYQIEGLPEQFDPIQIQISFNGQIAGDTLVAIGEKGYAKSCQDSAYAYIAQKATVQNSMLCFTLGGATSLHKISSTSTKSVGPPVRFTAIDGYTTTVSRNNHFEVHHPLSMTAQAAQLSDFFEAAYDTFQTMGCSFSGRTRIVAVMVADISTDGEYTFFMPSNPTDASIHGNLNKGRFTISKNIMNDPQQMAVTAGHEFMHLVQNIYEFSDPYIKPEQTWLSEALAVWAGSKFATDPNYISPELVDNEIRFFLGWQHASALHGYGMSTLIKNIADTYGDAAIVNILEKIEEGNVPAFATDPVDAVLSVISDPLEQFWHNSLGNYILGGNYNGTVSRNLLSDPANFAFTFIVDGPEDTLKNMLCGFNDLSGALIKIELGYADIDSAASLIVSVDDSIHCGMMICAYKNGAINLLKDILPCQNGMAKLPNVHQLTQAGQDLVVLISNGKHESPYNGTNDVDISLQINTSKRENPPGSPPQLIVPRSIEMGYWKYLRYCQTPYGQSDVLFSYKLSGTNSSATASIFKPDSGWIYSQPINDASSLDFAGAQLATIVPNMCPGATDSIVIRVENEFGADTAVTHVNIGNFFDGVVIEDSLANWKDNFHPEWFCIDPSLSGPFSGSSLVSSVTRQNYECGVVKSLSHSTISQFSLSLDDCKITGSGSNNYKIVSSQAQPEEEQWISQYTFNSAINAALTSFDDVDYFLFINVDDVNASITRRELWTSSSKPDSVWTSTEQKTGSFAFGFKGQIQH